MNRYETRGTLDEKMHATLHCWGNSCQLEYFVCFSRALVAQKYLVHVVYTQVSPISDGDGKRVLKMLNMSFGLHMSFL